MEEIKHSDREDKTFIDKLNEIDKKSSPLEGEKKENDDTTSQQGKNIPKKNRPNIFFVICFAFAILIFIVSLTISLAYAGTAQPATAANAANNAGIKVEPVDKAVTIYTLVREGGPIGICIVVMFMCGFLYKEVRRLENERIQMAENFSEKNHKTIEVCTEEIHKLQQNHMMEITTIMQKFTTELNSVQLDFRKKLEDYTKDTYSLLADSANAIKQSTEAIKQNSELLLQIKHSRSMETVPSEQPPAIHKSRRNTIHDRDDSTTPSIMSHYSGSFQQPSLKDFDLNDDSNFENIL